MSDLPGISYVRTTREATPSLYGPDEEFPVGGSKTLRDGSDVALVAAGITLHESLRAADRLAADGISARVIDCYSVKPIDAAALRAAAADTGLIVVTEDHRIEGGLGDAVLDALAETSDVTGRVIKLAVTDMPGSGTPEELRAWAGIDADAIVGAVRDALGRD
jgi:transketolase